MDVFIKCVIVIFFSCVLVTGCQSNARQEDDIENVLINSNIDNDISQNEHKMCDYLSSKYEEYLSELEGIETVNSPSGGTLRMVTNAIGVYNTSNKSSGQGPSAYCFNSAFRCFSNALYFVKQSRYLRSN